MPFHLVSVDVAADLENAKPVLIVSIPTGRNGDGQLDSV